jgi:hypothetical protein
VRLNEKNNLMKTVNQLLFENLDHTHYTDTKTASKEYEIFNHAFKDVLGYDEKTGGCLALQKGHQPAALVDELCELRVENTFLTPFNTNFRRIVRITRISFERLLILLRNITMLRFVLKRNSCNSYNSPKIRVKSVLSTLNSHTLYYF